MRYVVDQFGRVWGANGLGQTVPFMRNYPPTVAFIPPPFIPPKSTVPFPYPNPKSTTPGECKPPARWGTDVYTKEKICRCGDLFEECPSHCCETCPNGDWSFDHAGYKAAYDRWIAGGPDFNVDNFISCTCGPNPPRPDCIGGPYGRCPPPPPPDPTRRPCSRTCCPTKPPYCYKAHFESDAAGNLHCVCGWWRAPGDPFMSAFGCQSDRCCGPCPPCPRGQVRKPITPGRFSLACGPCINPTIGDANNNRVTPGTIPRDVGTRPRPYELTIVTQPYNPTVGTTNTRVIGSSSR